MTALDYILDGLEAALELERELGVRSFEIDRTLLALPPSPVPTERPPVRAETPPLRDVSPRPIPREPVRPAEKPPALATSGVSYPFVFLHDRPLSAAGGEMMSKIVAAMGHTPETAPVVVASPVPKARVYVVLGGLALRRYFPGVKGAPGVWTQAEDGSEILVTYSPEYILRFKTVTPAVKRMKQDMWTSLKAVLQKSRFERK